MTLELALEFAAWFTIGFTLTALTLLIIRRNQ